MKTISCAIVDDEPKSIALLIESLALLNKSVVVKDTYTSWQKALEGLRENTYDLLLLDIAVREKNGMDLLRFLPDLQSEVIFITAHPDYALSAFRYSASGYILKPVDDLELANALDHAIKRIVHKRPAQAYQQQKPGKLGIPDGKSINYISMDDIVYLEATQSYTRVVTTHEEILSAYNIGKFKALLPDPAFCQVHRSYIININRVRRYGLTGTVQMDNEKEVPVSRSMREYLLGCFARVKPDQKQKNPYAPE